jgi:hypothetical protein
MLRCSKKGNQQWLTIQHPVQINRQLTVSRRTLRRKSTKLLQLIQTLNWICNPLAIVSLKSPAIRIVCDPILMLSCKNTVSTETDAAADDPIATG